MIDFEIAAKKAFEKVFIGILVKGCLPPQTEPHEPPQTEAIEPPQTLLKFKVKKKVKLPI